jgi:hypothetical protein
MSYYSKDGIMYQSCDSCAAILRRFNEDDATKYKQDLEGELEEETEPELCETCEDNSDWV